MPGVRLRSLLMSVCSRVHGWGVGSREGEWLRRTGQLSISLTIGQ